MAKCTRCGKETELYEAGIPICPACIDEREGKRRPREFIIPDERDPNETK